MIDPVVRPSMAGKYFDAPSGASNSEETPRNEAHS